MAALKCCILIFMEMKLKGNVTNQIIHAETRQVMQPVQNNMEHVKYIPGVEEERDSGSSLREGGKAGRRELSIHFVGSFQISKIIIVVQKLHDT